MKESAIVVGGGIVGIASALLLKEKYKQVYLVERAPTIGGLLNSIEKNNSYYDFGTHIPAMTGQPELDNILFNLDSDFPGWYEIPYLKVANYHNKAWNPESPLVDIRTLDNYKEALKEFTSLPEADMTEERLGDFIEKYFGKIIADQVYRPIFKKLHGVDISELAQKIVYNFCLHRVIAHDSEKTKELKKDPKFDSKLGFHSYKDVPENNYRYPKSFKGCGEWISALERKLSKAGITVINDAEVTDIQTENDRVTSIKINNEEICCDFLAWTIPPIFFQKQTGDMPQASFRPNLRVATLLNLKLDKPILRDNHYVFVWDSEVSMWRMTFYKNLREDLEAQNLLSIEYLSDAPIEESIILDSVKEELLSMGLINQEHKILESQTLNLGPVFPVVSPEFVKHSAHTKDMLEGKYKNFKVLGKSGGKNFLLNNLLLDAYSEIANL